MSREMVPWLFVLMLLVAGMALAIVHARSVEGCSLAPIEAGTGETAQPVRSEGRKRDRLQNKDRDHV